MSNSASSSAPQTVQSATLIGIAGLCVALNVGLGAIVYLIKLPVYLDAIGTIACALLAGALGWRGFVLAAFVGAVSFVITGLLLNPVIMWFIPTQIAIAAYCFWIARPVLRTNLATGQFGTSGVVRVVLLGLGLGLFAGIVSAPMITYVFGGITGAGASVIVAVPPCFPSPGAPHHNPRRG